MFDRKQFSPRPPRDEDFAIGGWQVQPACNRICHSRQGIEKRLEPRLMHLLSFLAANSGRILSRDVLIAELWPRVIVTENSLTRAVSELRKHLADGEGFARIETVPKKGYRLVAETPATGRTWRHALPWPVLAVPALAVAVLTVGWLADRSTAPVSSFEFEAGEVVFDQEFIPVSTADSRLSGVQQAVPVLSADGNHYAFIRHDTAGSTIWFGDLRDGSAPIAVYTSSMPLANLTWSPAGNALLFARRNAIVAEAVYGSANAMQLMQLDLTTWEASLLIEELEATEQTLPAEIDLT